MVLVALLRGINVGASGKGRKSVPMAQLRELAEGIGFRDVRTYIQSGNVVFGTSVAAAKAEQKLESAIAEHFGFDVPVIVRPIDELVRLAGKCPFADVVDDRPNLVHIGVAKSKLDRSATKVASGYCVNGERIVVQGQVIWIDYASGVAGSKLTPAVLDRAFGSPVTARNIKTLHAIAAMAD